MLLCNETLRVTVDELTGHPVALSALADPHGMNWIRGDYPFGKVIGFETVRTEPREDGILVFCENRDRSLGLTVRRWLSGECYLEEYCVENLIERDLVLSEDSLGIVFSYSDVFDKSRPDMLDTRCNSHVFCAGEVCRIHSVRLCGYGPYLIEEATCGSFGGYGLLCDIRAASLGSHDRGSIVLYPEERILRRGERAMYAFRFRFSQEREPISFVFADHYSGFLFEEFLLRVEWPEAITSLSCGVSGEAIPFTVEGNRAFGKVKFSLLGEKKVEFVINGRRTHLFLNVLRPLEEILKSRVAFITKKQQYTGEDERLRGAYLIYDREEGRTYCNEGFPDHNSARERLSMGALVALSLSVRYDAEVAASLRLHRAFVEREIVNVETGDVKNGIASGTVRLYNFPWASTYYLEWYRFSGETECLLIAARILRRYYALGGARQESPCIEAFTILSYLRAEGLSSEYEALLEDFLSHASSIRSRRTSSSSSEVSCANGMMNLMATFLFEAYLLSRDHGYLSCIGDLLKISESFYDRQPDYRMHGIALRYWDMYWFGKGQAYGDTYPQWLSTLTAQMYHYCDKALGTDHRDLIRDNLLGNCCVFFEDGSASCGYLYPRRVTVFSSDPAYENRYRPTGVWEGRHFDAFANDQDWALYYAVKYLMADAGDGGQAGTEGRG